MGVYELLGQAPQVAWGLLAVAYLACMQVGAALALFCASTGLGAAPLRSGALWSRTTLALGLTAAAPLSLVVEMGQPGRAASLFWRGAASSPLSYGVWCIGGVTLFLALFCLGLWRGRVGRGVSFALAVSSVATLSYTMAEVGYVASLPLWSAPATPVLLLASAVAGAYGLWLALDPERPKRAGLPQRLAWACLAVLFCAGWLCLGLSAGDADAQRALGYLLGPGRGLFFWAGLAFGAVVPAMAGLVRTRGGLAVFACLLPLLGVVALRLAVILGGQLLLRGGQGAAAFDAALTGHGGLIEALASPALALGIWLLLGMSFFTAPLADAKESA